MIESVGRTDAFFALRLFELVAMTFIPLAVCRLEHPLPKHLQGFVVDNAARYSAGEAFERFLSVGRVAFGCVKNRRE